RTSPYQFFQYLMQVDDRDVERFLRQLTLLPIDEVTSVVERHRAAPERRLGQRSLAAAATTLVHGEASADAAAQATGLLFGGHEGDLGEGAYEALAGEIPT